jgi:hypothetical protein
MWKKVELAELAFDESGLHGRGRGSPTRPVCLPGEKTSPAEAAPCFCANEGLHLHGGYGFTSEYEISKLVRDAHIIDIYEGVREVQHMIMGREFGLEWFISRFGPIPSRKCHHQPLPRGPGYRDNERMDHGTGGDRDEADDPSPGLPSEDQERRSPCDLRDPPLFRRPDGRPGGPNGPGAGRPFHC